MGWVARGIQFRLQGPGLSSWVGGVPCTAIRRMGARKEFVGKSRFQSAKFEMQRKLQV